MLLVGIFNLKPGFVIDAIDNVETLYHIELVHG